MRILPIVAIFCLALGCDSQPEALIAPRATGDPLAVLTADLKSTDPGRRRGAADALGAMGPQAKPAAEDLLAALREDDDDAVRAEAAWALARIGSDEKDLVPFLIDRLGDESEETQGMAIVGLGRIGPDAEPAVPRLIDLLETGNPLLQRLAAEALGDIGPRAAAAIPALNVALEGDPGLSKVASEALPRIRRQAVR